MVEEIGDTVEAGDHLETSVIQEWSVPVTILEVVAEVLQIDEIGEVQIDVEKNHRKNDPSCNFNLDLNQSKTQIYLTKLFQFLVELDRLILQRKRERLKKGLRKKKL